MFNFAVKTHPKTVIVISHFLGIVHPDIKIMYRLTEIVLKLYDYLSVFKHKCEIWKSKPVHSYPLWLSSSKIFFTKSLDQLYKTNDWFMNQTDLNLSFKTLTDPIWQ